MSGFVYFFQSFASAASSSDILYNRTFKFQNGTSTNTNATDHDSSTYLEMGAASSGTGSFTLDLNGKAATISKIRVNAVHSDGTLTSGFVVEVSDIAGKPMWANPFKPGDSSIDVSLKNVGSIKFYIQTTNSPKSYLYDFEIYGDVNYVYPSGLKGSSDSRAVKLDWNSISDPDLTGFNVYQDGNKITNTPIKGIAYTVNGLVPDKEYNFYITAVYLNSYETIASNTVKVSAYDDLPEKPVIIAEPKKDSILLKWTSARAVSFYLFYVNGKLITVTNDRQYEVTGLDTNQVYSFYVVAYDKYGRSSYSDVVSFSTKPPPPPVPPKIIVSSKTYETINVIWDQVGMFYDVFLDGALLKQTTGTLYNFEQLSPDTEYEIKIISTDQFNQKAESILKVNTNPLPPVKKPTIKVSGKTWNSIDIYWDDVGTWYEIYLNGVSVAQTVDLTTQFKNLTENTDYSIKVVTTDKFGRLAEGTLSVKTESIPKPVNFTIRSLSVTKNSLRLSWMDAAGITQYDVYQDGQNIGSSKSSFYQVNGLTPDTSYSFYVSYVDSFGRTIKSNDLVVTTLKEPPPPTGNPGGGGGVIGNPNTPPPVSNSGNNNLNKGNDKLLQGVDDMKLSGIKLVMAIIGVFIIVFFSIWIWKIIKRNLSKTKGGPVGDSGNGKGNSVAGTTGSPDKKNVQSNYKATQTKNTKNSPKMARKMRLYNYEKSTRIYQGKNRRY